MNKYESFALRNAGYAIYKSEDCSSDSRIDAKGDSWSTISENDLSIVVKQDANYNIVKYYLRFQTTVSKVVAAGKEYLPVGTVSSSNPNVVVPLDFADKIKEVTVHFHDVIDPMKISIKFIEADKKIYDEQMRKEHEAELIKKAGIKVATGADLVNIYFQPCCGDYENTSIELYLADGIFSKCNWSGNQAGFVPELIGGTIKQLIGKFKVEEGMMYKSITGLAKGVYGYRLSQYNNKGDCLFTTNYAYFRIE